MKRNPPQPFPQSYLLCREIFFDETKHEYVLIAPLSRIVLGALPGIYRLSIFMQLTGGHGAYRLTVELRDDEGIALRQNDFLLPVRLNDPLVPHRVCWPKIELQFPRAGRYDLVIKSNGEDLAHHFLNVVLRAN